MLLTLRNSGTTLGFYLQLYEANMNMEVVG